MKKAGFILIWLGLMLFAVTLTAQPVKQAFIFHFDSDKAELNAGLKHVYQKYTERTLLADSATIVVIGHTDSDGDEQYNRRLSFRRAQAVANALSETGIEMQLMKIIGEGELKPVAPNDSEEAKALNRRVAVEITYYLPEQEAVTEELVEEPPVEPEVVGCPVHLSGLLMSAQIDSMWYAVIGEEDHKSECLFQGEYPNAGSAYPKANAHSLDGIAVEPGVRLVVFDKPNYQGKVLLDVTGPAVVNNRQYRHHVPRLLEHDYGDHLNEDFPQEVRQWSKSAMHYWENGSLKIYEPPAVN